jgi:hypothetical protein
MQVGQHLVACVVSAGFLVSLFTSANVLALLVLKYLRFSSGNIWRLVWYPLVFFNCLHIAWPIGLTALEMQSGRAGTLALLLTVLQSGASGYAWHNGLRLRYSVYLLYCSKHKCTC